MEKKFNAQLVHEVNLCKNYSWFMGMIHVKATAQVPNGPYILDLYLGKKTKSCIRLTQPTLILARP